MVVIAHKYQIYIYISFLQECENKQKVCALGYKYIYIVVVNKIRFCKQTAEIFDL